MDARGIHNEHLATRGDTKKLEERITTLERTPKSNPNRRHARHHAAGAEDSLLQGGFTAHLGNVALDDFTAASSTHAEMGSLVVRCHGYPIMILLQVDADYTDAAVAAGAEVGAQLDGVDIVIHDHGLSIGGATSVNGIATGAIMWVTTPSKGDHTITITGAFAAATDDSAVFRNMHLVVLELGTPSVS